MARELAPEGIRVVAVAPGAITSGGYEDAESDPQALATSEAGIPSHRLGRPEDVAELIACLVSPEAAYITGTSVIIDGVGTAGVVELRRLALAADAPDRALRREAEERGRDGGLEGLPAVGPQEAGQFE
ncbi:MAG: SDR family oxidoreductase [Acidimicrobiales bacterium]